MIKEDIIHGIIDRGYDAFINKDDIMILKDGYQTVSPLSGAITLLNSSTIKVGKAEIIIPPIPLTEVVNMMIDNHTTKRDIDAGKYDNSTPMTDEESKKFFKKLLNKDE